MTNKVFLFLCTTLCYLTTFGQRDSSESLTFNFFEIQVFTGLTKSGTHILKLDNQSLTLRKPDSFADYKATTELLYFNELKGEESKELWENLTTLWEYLDDFDYATYEPLKEKKEVVIVEGDTLTREHLISTNDLGTRILIIDNNHEAHFIKYYFCEKPLDELVDKINKVIPIRLRSNYEFVKRCK